MATYQGFISKKRGRIKEFKQLKNTIKDIERIIEKYYPRIISRVELNPEKYHPGREDLHKVKAWYEVQNLAGIYMQFELEKKYLLGKDVNGFVLYLGFKERKKFHKMLLDMEKQFSDSYKIITKDQIVWTQQWII